MGLGLRLGLGLGLGFGFGLGLGLGLGSGHGVQLAKGDAQRRATVEVGAAHDHELAAGEGAEGRCDRGDHHRRGVPGKG